MKAIINAVLLSALIILTTTIIITNIQTKQHEINKKYEELEKIRAKNQEQQLNTQNKQAKTRAEFIRTAQTIENKTELEKQYEITEWNNDYVIANNTTIHYPIKEFIEKTNGLTVEQVTQCACNNPNSCNQLNNTDYDWKLEPCTGIPPKNKIKIIKPNTPITRIAPYYLYKGECKIQCIT